MLRNRRLRQRRNPEHDRALSAFLLCRHHRAQPGLCESRNHDRKHMGCRYGSCDGILIGPHSTCLLELSRLVLWLFLHGPRRNRWRDFLSSSILWPLFPCCTRTIRLLRSLIWLLALNSAPIPMSAQAFSVSTLHSQSWVN